MDPLQAFRRRFAIPSAAGFVADETETHGHDAADISGVFGSITVSGDIWSDNWNGAIPANLAAGADTAASAGLYWDSSAGALQAFALYAEGGSLESLTVAGTLTMGVSGLVKSIDYTGSLGWQLDDTGFTCHVGSIDADTLNVAQLDAICGFFGTLTVDETLTMGASGVIKSTDYDATHGWSLGTTGLTIHVGTIDAAAINATTLSAIQTSTGSLTVTGTLTLSGSGKLETIGGYSVGGLVQAVVLTAAATDRITFYSGDADETVAALIQTSVSAGVPYLRIMGTSTSAGVSIINLYPTELALIGDVSVSGDASPNANNAYDLGTAALSWRNLFAYGIYDEAGVERWDLSGNITCAGTITSEGTAVSLTTHTHDYSGTYLGLTAQAADSHTVDGQHASYFSVDGHVHASLSHATAVNLSAGAGNIYVTATQMDMNDIAIIDLADAAGAKHALNRQYADLRYAAIGHTH